MADATGPGRRLTMPTSIARSLLVLAVLASLAALAIPPPPMQDQMGVATMFTDVVAEQALALPRPADPDEAQASVHVSDGK